jgi:acetylornithine deacetylase
MEIREKIDQTVESLRDEALELLQSIVRIPSLPGQEKPVQDVIAHKMTEMGLELDIWDPVDENLQSHPAYIPSEIPYTGRPNVVGTWKGSGEGQPLIFNGHVDVVPTGEEENWTNSPWSGTFIDGKVYGRGSADMKAGCVVNLMVVRALQLAGIKLKGDIVLESVVDEENGGNGTLACVLRGYTGGGMVFTEPSSDAALGVAQRGAQFFRLTIDGVEGSIEGRYDLVNPIGKALQIYQAVESYSVWRESTVSHPLYDPFYKIKVPLAICKINAGQWASTIPSSCILEGSIEALPGEDIEDIKQGFKNYLQHWSIQDPWFEQHPIKVEWWGLRLESAEVPVDHPFVLTAAEEIEQVIGHPPIIGGGGGCDLRLPVLYGNTPAVIYGPRGGMVHCVDEFVEFEQVVTCTKVLANLAVRWCGLDRSLG